MTPATAEWHALGGRARWRGRPPGNHRLRAGSGHRRTRARRRLGILGRRCGLLSDSLRAATVVLADGRVVACDAERHADLFWALRGAGAYPNFPEEGLEDWPRAYHGANLERLVAVRERYHPDDVFRAAQSIPTRATASRSIG